MEGVGRMCILQRKTGDIWKTVRDMAKVNNNTFV